MKQRKHVAILTVTCVVQQVLSEGTVLEINIALMNFFNIFPTVGKNEVSTLTQ